MVEAWDTNVEWKLEVSSWGCEVATLGTGRRVGVGFWSGGLMDRWAFGTPSESLGS